ncbi:3-deoxy-7-phosphoheptulonate synthase [Bifidobacterium pullorum subsp. gallinarum]|uniref:Phospho-2-dehydro-3-deoxyheptonate aldolase n=1 Tax=Bifidobacterium pullorum subsp. gallinarum TaxID=78344 RepID=A0A087ANT5_9BIFI|nr:3-deoxy-7-phosphoheptulonate synthase [Bifidobacterium pullorum]KFI60435.1 3-deoxy-7-phosphoheptulonate synthase [Bifidobacterium pullorum subsp. gallinarum]
MQPEPQPLNSPEDVEAIRKVIRQGGNPLVDTDVPRWEDQVGVSRIVNRRVVEIEPLPTPAQVLADMPLSETAQRVVVESRDAIRNVLHGRDDRLLVIVGPCSVHDPRAALDYARRLSALNGELKDELLIVMRVYFEKPRTTVGWKGLINDPDIDGSHNIRKGLLLARRVLLGVLDEGVPAATEFLEPTSPQYIADAVSWGAIGARNTESQIHRQLASGLSMPIGFKNATDGSVKAAINGCYAAAQQHGFFGVDHLGRACVVETLGNPDCHVVLRGSSHGPNYDAGSIAAAMAEARAEMPEGSAAVCGLVVDCSHGNSGKDEVRQTEVVRELAARIAAGEPGIAGLMMESFIEGGNQPAGPLDTLVYGRSITDRCISWPDTEALLRDLARAVAARRS